jgi:hypothetical protein
LRISVFKMAALEASSNPEGQEAAAKLDDEERSRAAGVIQVYLASTLTDACLMLPSRETSEAIERVARCKAAV